ncbi:nickel/cobalt efflux protein RcnA [Rahnella victoriana]|uniref:nickel/cobalt efflux protein RcnA n=1 Tax=Rahnella victoriana TaxID=1510570 RepID=UPI001E5A730B|nr:nickel/cobalt efflux protein RcnA [Rahnella victoriana]UHM90153.1 nickel/cobalt efflux protein RcnA [Rahnella victoriana]
MNDFSTLLQQGNAWLYMPGAILLGILHGLEPGHSKTMMAAFIIAIKGTVRQAVLLGLAATVSHTAIVWIIAFGGMVLSNRFTAEAVEPWLQLVSAVIILGTAMWMFWRTFRGEQLWKREQAHGHHGDHAHHHEHDHHHGPAQTHTNVQRHVQPQGLSNLRSMTRISLSPQEYQDAHELAHASDIQRRFASTEVTNGQIVFFGLTGGLIPCPAAITVLLICIQLKQLALGATMVVCFSLGLALTLVTVGVAAAVSVRQATKRWSGLNTLARRAPYFSSVLIGLVGIYMGVHAFIGLTS